MGEGGVFDDEVGGEHGGGDFAAVGAVADEGVDEVGAFDGLGCFVSCRFTDLGVRFLVTTSILTLPQ